MGVVLQCVIDFKDQLGLDEHQVRRWNSWHRWVTLAMAAAAFLTITATTERAASTPAGLVPLTRNETARLFTTLTGHQPTTPDRLAWSRSTAGVLEATMTGAGRGRGRARTDDTKSTGRERGAGAAGPGMPGSGSGLGLPGWASGLGPAGLRLRSEVAGAGAPAPVWDCRAGPPGWGLLGSGSGLGSSGLAGSRVGRCERWHC